MTARIDFSQVSRSPKTTVVGLCVLALAAERGVHFDAAGHVAMSARDWFEVGCGALTAFVSGVSQDASQATEGQQQPAVKSAEASAPETTNV